MIIRKSIVSVLTLALLLVVMAISQSEAFAAPGDDKSDFDIDLKISAEQASDKSFKNLEGEMKVEFTAKWSSASKAKALIGNGWELTYKLVDQDEKTLKSGFDITNGVLYKVKEDEKYAILAVFSKSGKGKHIIKSDAVGEFHFPEKPKKIKAKCPKTENTVTLKWSKVKGATAYYLYRGKKKSALKKPFKIVTGTEYKDKNLKGKKIYHYAVQAVREDEVDGSDYMTVSPVSKSDKVKVNKFLTGKIRKYKWYAKLRGKSTLFKTKTGSATKGSIKGGTKVYLGKTYPSHVPQHVNPRRVIVKLMKGNKVVKSGWVTYGHVSGRVRAEVSYVPRDHRGYDWTKSKKEKFVNKNKFSSPNKYMIWVSTYTQRVNIFKGRKGHWKLIKTHRCVTGRFLHRTKFARKARIRRKRAKRIRNFYNSTSQYWMHSLSYFTKGNSFHTICWRVGSNTVVNVIKANHQPGTKGCVRCPEKDAVWIYKNIPIGTRVVIH